MTKKEKKSSISYQGPERRSGKERRKDLRRKVLRRKEDRFKKKARKG